MANQNRRWLSLLAFAGIVLAVGGRYLWVNEAGSTELGLRVVKLRSVTTKGSPTGIAWSPDGQKIAAIHDFGRAISVWNSIGEPIVLIKREVTTGPYVGSSLTFMRDNRTIVAPAPTPTHTNTSSLGLWDGETGALQRVVPEPSSDKVFQAIIADIFTLSPDGSLIAFRPISGEAPISIYRTDNWSLVKTRSILRNEMQGLKPSTATGILPNDHAESVTALAFAPNNELAAGLVRGVVMLGSDLSSTSLRFIESRQIECLAYSPNGQFIAAGIAIVVASPATSQVARLQIRDVASGRVVVEDNTIGDVRSLAWDRDGQILAVATTHQTVHLYRPFSSGNTHQDMSVSKGAFALSFSPTKSELAISTETGVDFYSIK